MALLTVVAGLFICVAGLYVNIKAIVDAYVSTLGAPKLDRKNVLLTCSPSSRPLELSPRHSLVNSMSMHNVYRTVDRI